MGKGVQPDSEGFCEVLVRVALGIPGIEVEDEALAVGFWRVVIGVGIGGFAKQFLPASPSTQEVCVLNGVPGLVAEDTHAPLGSPALDFEELIQLKPCQAGMGHVKGNGASWNAVGREPVIRKPEVRPKTEVPVF